MILLRNRTIVKKNRKEEHGKALVLHSGKRGKVVKYLLSDVNMWYNDVHAIKDVSMDIGTNAIAAFISS